MRYRLIAVTAAALALTGCQLQPHPPLRYVERHYHHAPRQPYYAVNPYHGRDRYHVRQDYYSGRSLAPLEGTQMRQAMNRDRVMHGNGCYPTWCPRGGW